MDTKLYTLKWEEENDDKEKENNHTRQKIGGYLHLDELRKFENGKYIMKKFDRLSSDGEIVSINLDTKFYHIRYTDEDEKDMIVSGVQKFWIAKEVNNEKRES